MSWEAYEAIVAREWKELRERVSAVEADYQAFFERHPCMLPIGFQGSIGGHHGAFPAAVISQPPFAGLVRRVPDFMTISKDSAGVHIRLIEIERPDKEWFTVSGQPTADLTQAMDQLREWKQWLTDPINMQQFKRDYRFPEYYLQYTNFVFHYILIYGSNNERTERYKNKRFFLQQPGDIFMTFDRLFPDEHLKNYLTVKLDQHGYRAVSIPPTFRLGPMRSEFNPSIRDKHIAVEENKYLSQARKKFLTERLPYWDEICKNGRPKGIIPHSKTGE